MTAERLPASPQPSGNQFEDIVGHENWSDEAKILDAPTPLDIAISSDRYVDPKASAEFEEFLPKLDAIVTKLGAEDGDGSTESFLGGRGMMTLNEMMDISVDTLNGDEILTKAHRHYSKPQGHEAIRVVEAFPNPADFVSKFDELMDIRERQYASGEYGTYSRTEQQQTMEQIAEVIYGDRWGVYKDTLGDVEELQETEVPSEVREQLTSEPEIETPDPERVEHELEAHEVLSDFQIYRTDVREGATEFITDVQRKIAQARNTISSPKNAFLKLRRDRMQDKYDRISAKQDSSRLGFINRHRDRKAAKAYDKLQHREATLQGHNDKMQSRIDRVENKGNERFESIAQRRKELMEARITALESKMLREAKRARRHELAKDRSLSHAEREKKVRTFTKEDLAHIRKAAMSTFRTETERG